MPDEHPCETSPLMSPSPSLSRETGEPRPRRPLPAIHRLRPQAYYGWFVVAGGFILSFVAVGIGFYGQTVFLDGLIREKGWAKETVSGASTLYFIVSGIAGNFVGRAVDRWGARGLIFVGSLVMAASLLGLGRVERPAELFVVYAVLAVGFAMTAGVPLNALLARWFIRRRAFAMSLSQTGVSLGGIVLVPAATLLIAKHGIELTSWLLAALVLLVMWPVTVWVIRWDPADYGLSEDGQPGAQTDSEELRLWRARDAIRTASFLKLALAFSSILFCQTGLSVHLLHLLREHLDAAVAASGVSLVALGSIVGRLLIGQVADRVEKRWLVALLFVVQASAHLAMSLADGKVQLLGATLLFGLTIGSIFMLQSLLVMEIFGVASFGKIFGLLNLVTSMAGGLGPLAVGAVATHLGGYPSALLMLSCMAGFGAVVALGVRPPRPG